MYKVTMRYDWHDGAVFHFYDLEEASVFMDEALKVFVPQTEDQELVFEVKKIEEETENAKTVCGTEEG